MEPRSKTNSPDPARVVHHLLELLGGPAKALAQFEEEHARMNERWNQDTGRIGRILKAHLFVEYYLAQYLAAMNPELGSVAEARLTFNQKVALIGTRSSLVYLLPGLRHMNVVRNRLAHSLEAKLSEADAQVFLELPMFRAFREASASFAPTRPSLEPICVLEDFAKHAGTVLYACASGGAAQWAEAMRRAQSESDRKAAPD